MALQAIISWGFHLIKGLGPNQVRPSWPSQDGGGSGLAWANGSLSASEDRSMRSEEVLRRPYLEGT